MLTFIDGEPLKAGLLLRGSTVIGKRQYGWEHHPYNLHTAIFIFFFSNAVSEASFTQSMQSLHEG